MPKPRTEEQFPLLLVLVGEQDGQGTKGQFGRGRFDGIASGATTIITEWPNYLSSCWLTALVCGIALFIISIMLSSCMTLHNYPRLPRCTSDLHLTGNKTVHLVHTSHKWYPTQTDLLQAIVDAFPTYQIHLLIITKSITNSTNSTDDLIPTVLSNRTNVIITQDTFKNIFDNSPLFLNWISLNHQMKNFAVRVLQLWQNGGLSFDLLEHRIHTPRRHKNFTYVVENKVKHLIQKGLKRYEGLSQEVVSVDRNGFHMECKTPCHVFFGRVLMKLRGANERVNQREVLGGAMYTFCGDGVIDREFCHVKNIWF